MRYIGRGIIMSRLAEIVLGLCISGIAGGVIYILSPSGPTKKLLGFVIGIFTLGCIVLPLSKLDISSVFSDEHFKTAESFTADKLDYTLKVEYERLLINDIKKYLSDEGITVKSIEPQYESLNDNPGLETVTKILVYTSGPVNKNKYENKLKEIYGTDVLLLREEANKKEN